MKPGRTGFIRIIHAAGYSWKGIVAALRHESAFRQELFLAVIMLPLAIWLGSDTVEYILLIASVLLVLIVELLNSALEAVVDRTGHEWHELSGRAKDMGSAAVFIALLLVFIVWGAILYQRFA
jgi:diacylglycerol kinase (ATP)